MASQTHEGRIRLEQHPFINDDLPNRILCGSVLVRPNVKEFTDDGHGVIFEDGSRIEHVDCVLMATGFNIAFPYLDEKILPVNDNRVSPMPSWAQRRDLL